MTTLKQQIANTKQEALDLLSTHLWKEWYYGFGSYIAREVGISSGMLTYINQKKRPMSYENALLILDAWNGIAESIEPPKNTPKNPKWKQSSQS